jgi:hypothetical protein
VSFDLELGLDRLDAELASELPSHVRAFARAYADTTAIPTAPAITHRRASIDLARRALADEALASRGLGLLRLLAPIAIEDDPGVASARSATPRTWAAWSGLAIARDTASVVRLGGGHLAWMHWLHGVDAPPRHVEWPSKLEGWHAPAPVIPAAFVERAWRDLADRHGAQGSCRIVHAEARPRTFVVAPGEAIVVLGSIETPAMRFAALHELGHALGALLSPALLPRVVDEALAAYVARMIEREGDLDLPWHTPLAETARHRRLAISIALDGYERGLRPAIEEPPWALWHDPGAQAVYAAAEAIAERWWNELGPMPDRGALASAIRAEHARVDRETLARRP